MFIIVNQTNTNVLFSDLKKVPPLKSGKALDLDKILPREESNRSKDLKDAIKSKIIKVIVKDNKEADRESDKVEERSKKIIEDQNTKDIIQQEVQRQIKEILENISVKDNNNQDILNAIQDLTKKIDHGTKKSSETNSSEKENMYIDTDESKLVDIHAKSMNRLLKKTDDDSSKFKTDVIKSKANKEDLDDLANLLN